MILIVQNGSCAAEGHSTAKVDPKSISVPNLNPDKNVEAERSIGEARSAFIGRSNKGKSILDPDYILPPFALTERMGPEEWDEFIEALQVINDACGPEANKHDRAIVLISFCIDNGIDTIGHIINVLKRFGFHQGHIGSLLKDLSGHNAEVYWWSRDSAGRYRNLR